MAYVAKPNTSSQSRHYDPRPKDEQKAADKAVVWSTVSVNWALEMVKMGQDLDRSPFYEGKIDRRKGDLVFQMSDMEHDEWVKCASDILYFIEKYCMVKLPTGLIGNIKLRKYQYGQILDYLENDEIILGWSRQSGKTIGTALYILWCMCFNANKHCALLANKGSTSGEVLNKIKEIYAQLPFFLKPGVLGWNGGTVAFDNGCKIYTGPTTEDALNGRTCNILYIDEFAYIGEGKNKIEFQKNFLANAKPVLSSQKDSGLCKLIISSTPVGKDFFYELFNDALKKKNSMKASIVRWWEIPGRDLKWAKKELAGMGHDIAKFRQQFEVSFDVSAYTLLSTKTMKSLQKGKIKFKSFDDLLDDYSEYLYVNPRFELNYDDFILFSVDLAEGLKKDFSVIQMLRLKINEETGEMYFEQLGKFSCNEIPLEQFALVVKRLMSNFDPDSTKLLVESNTYGDYFFKCFDSVEEYDIPSENVCQFKRSADAEYLSRGLRTNRALKPIAVKSFKSLMDKSILKVYDDETIAQVENFQEDKKGNYKATIGHDDEVTPLINASYWINLGEDDYNFWLEDYLNKQGIEYDYEDAEELYD